MTNFKITKIKSRWILDSRGNPTVETEVFSDNLFSRAAVPSGASTGVSEALELRDGGTAFMGKHVSKAVSNVNEIIAKKVNGFDVREQEKIDNFYVLSLHKLCPPIMKTLLDLGEVRLNGIICPGHVSAIIGSRPYQFIPDNYDIACVVSGFEPLDILLCVEMLVNQIETGEHKVEIAYRRGVRPEGNQPALELMHSVFEVGEADWRGIGVVPSSGLILRERYHQFDAVANFDINPEPSHEAKECICGSILRGVSTPLDCKLFRNSCTPEHPVGPCMVSSEGSCATYYHYGDTDG